MSFASQETSRTLGEPIGLLLFLYGSGASDYCAYTDAEGPLVVDTLSAGAVTLNNVTFLPLPNTMDPIISSGTLDQQTVDLRVSQDADIVKLYDVFPPSTVVQVFAWEAHVDNSDIKMVWSGRVLGLKDDDTVTTAITCEPISTSMRRSGLRQRYGYGCRRVLYGEDCAAIKADATLVQEVLAIDGPKITLNADWAAADVQVLFQNGLAEWTSTSGRDEVRSIVKVLDPVTLLLSGTVVGLGPGGSINLVRGCNLQMGGCISHNNILNFGGFPWIPTKNPIGVTNNFY